MRRERQSSSIDKAQAALSYWITVDNNSYCVNFEGSVDVLKDSSAQPSLFVVSTYAPEDYC